MTTNAFPYLTRHTSNHDAVSQYFCNQDTSTIAGGDYVEIRQLPGDRKMFVIANVCGKGIEAAYIAHNLRRHVAQMIVNPRQTSDLPRFTTALQARMAPFLDYRHPFVTLVIGTISSKSGALHYVNAGHPAPVLVSTDGRRHLESGCNAPVGVLKERFLEHRANLNPEETLVLYTDGFSERVDEEGSPIGPAGMAIVARRCLTGFHMASLDFLSQKFRHTLGRLAPVSRHYDDSSFLLLRRVPLDAEVLFEHASHLKEGD